MATRTRTLSLARSDGRLLCETCVVADTTPRRLRGLIGRRSVAPGEGVVLRPAWSIHTAFLRFPVDVVFLDPDQVVMRVVENLPPWRAAVCRGAQDVVELAGGECSRRGIAAGDRVAWIAYSEDGAVPRLPLAHGADGNGDGGAREPLSVLLASRDSRFVRLASFLLGRGEFTVESTRKYETVPSLVERHRPDVVVIDASDSVASGARLVAVLDALSPSLGIVLVASEEIPRTTSSLRPLPKWETLERLPDAVAEAYARAGEYDALAHRLAQ